ncbi:MAG: phosphonate transport system substrate-binding protein [Myxococcota bacterium]|jgi:phosphonate transport system substrate-binding protein
MQTLTTAIAQRFTLTLLLALALALAACGKKTDDKAGGDRKARTVVRITAIPDENPTELQRKFQPMVTYLEKALDAEVKYIPVTDYGAAVQALVAGKIDFAWLGGFTHVQARNQTQAVPLAMRAIDREFKSVVIASTDSGIQTMDQLKGKTFAFGSKSSTSGHLMPRHFLTTQHNIDPEKDFNGAPVFSGAHDATAKMVESGKIQAGALNKEVFARMLKDGKLDPAKVKVVWTTPGYVDYNWTARKALDEGLRSKFQAAFLALDAANPEHKVVLDLQGAKKFVAATAADFDAIEGVATSTGLLKK